MEFSVYKAKGFMLNVMGGYNSPPVKEGWQASA